MARVQRQLQIPAFEQAEAAIPGWLPQTIPGAVRSPGTRLIFAAGLVAGTQAVVPRNGSISPALIGLVALYALSLGAALLVRLSPDRRLVLLGTGLALVLAAALGLSSAGILGALTLDILATILAYHLPARWALPLLGATAIVFVVTHVRYAGSTHALPGLSGAHPNTLGDAVILVALLILALTLRSRTMTIVHLHETQSRLQEEMERLRVTQARLEDEMERTARLAAGRERTRIARDMHDVLAHSLTMLSMQTQAIRQIIARDPAQATSLLDELAEVVRECIAESRHVVSTLRSATEVAAGASSLAEQLRVLAERFGQRTGLRCSIEEHGTVGLLTMDQEETLRYALQEALTNAFRHGAAQQLWVEIGWEPGAVTLNAHDDGAVPVGAPPSSALSGGGQGLHGMRERAAALGGTVRAGPREGGGFAVEITLPLAGDAVRPAEET